MKWLYLLMPTIPTGLLVYVFGATTVDQPIVGASGWAGAGLLGLVLAWLLLKHLPAKDEQLKEIMTAHSAEMARREERHDTAVVAMVQRNAEQDRERRADFRGALDDIGKVNERQMQIVVDNLGKDIGEIVDSIVAVRDSIQGLHDLALKEDRQKDKDKRGMV